jgi:flavin reductase (DIM6/NTAB) family NADH-FMN oxidoreductase RutF
VSSTLVADGDPGRILGLIDDESDLWDAVSVGERFAVVPLTPADRQLADRFAGLMPAPGGLFAAGEWTETPYGPVPAGATAWAGCRLAGSRSCGWSLLVEAVVEKVEFGPAAAPLIHYRGGYREVS